MTRTWQARLAHNPEFPIMSVSLSRRPAIALAIAAFACALATSATAAPDADAATTLARANNCFKCHSVSKDKDGPSFKQTAEKYRGKPEAQAKLVHHLTSGEQAKFKDGHTEDHKIIDTKDAAQIKNLVDWILIQ
jgi:cytochrome c